MKILLTGASGFLGRHVAALLVERGDACAALVRRDLRDTRLAPLAHRLTAIEGDLRAPQSYRDALARFAPQALIHCAWSGACGGAADDLSQHENVADAMSIVDEALEAGATIVIGVGSQAEYGAKPGPISERDALAPTTQYGRAKAAAGEATLAAAKRAGARGAWARIFSLYGADDDDGRRFLSMVARELAAGRAPRLTACEQIWDFLHVRDGAAAILALLDHPDAEGAFNVGSGAGATLRDVVLTLRDRLAPGVDPAFGALPYRDDQVMRLQADVSRIASLTRWRPGISLSDGLAELAGARLEAAA